MPAYKSRMWDGNLRLFNLMDGTLYLGLLPYVKKFAEGRDYDIVVDKEVVEVCEIDRTDTEEFLEQLKLPFKVREYQIGAIHHAITNSRALLLSPTGSGKSLLIYSLTRWYGEKTLVIVPTVSLVSQMWSDFRDYSVNDKAFNPDKHIHTIFSGQDKLTKKPVVITTWQSIYKMPKEWFAQFGLVIGDEVHLFKANCLKNIMTNLTQCKYRFGTTGTLDGTQTHKLVLEGLFGQTLSVTTTKELMDQNYLADLSITCIILKYSEEDAKLVKKLSYQDEIAFLVTNQRRNRFIRNLAVSMKSNTLVLFNYVESHGKILHRMIEEKAHETNPNRKIFFVAGETEKDVREGVRKITETEDDAIICASAGVFSTGINIQNLENLIFVAPSKSRVRTLQSIGRSLRPGKTGTATLYDIVDDLTHKSHKNFAIKHFLERVKIYNSERFKYKLHKIPLSSK